MSWEEFSVETRPCGCGNGTVTYRREMDDWNRVRDSTTINCPKCRADFENQERLRQQQEAKREVLWNKALTIARERYLPRWLEMFAGKSKKETWLLYTGGSGYPALGTFYKHVKPEGVEAYLRGHFSHDFPSALKRMGVEDSDIESLLRERERV